MENIWRRARPGEASLPTLSKRAELRGKISATPGPEPFLRVTPGRLLRAGKAKIKAEENLADMYLLRCVRPGLTPEDIALGCKRLLEAERAWRDTKFVLDLRPVYHRLARRRRTTPSRTPRACRATPTLSCPSPDRRPALNRDT